MSQKSEPTAGSGRRQLVRGCIWLLAVPLAILAEVVVAIRLQQKRERRRQKRIESRALDCSEKEPKHERA